MNIKKSDQNLLIVLGILVVLFLYLMFFYSPLNKEKTTLKNDIKELNKTINEKNINLSGLEKEYSDQVVDAEDNFDFETIPTKYDLASWKDSFFSDIEHDEIILLINRFVPVEAYINDSLYIGTTTFNVEEEIISSNYTPSLIVDENNSLAYHNYVTVDIVSEIGAFEQFIENIKSYDYPIFINSLEVEPYDDVIQNPTIDFTTSEPYSEISVEYFDNGFRYKTENENYLKGKIVLDFLEVPALREYNSGSTNYFEVIEVDMTDNPFVPFDDFYKVNIVNDEGSEQEIEKYKFENLYNFENNDFFFVGKPENQVRGTTDITSNAYSGSNALEVNYNFTKSPEENKAYAVNNENGIFINEKILGLYLNLYTDDEIPHTLGVVVRDNTGKETEIDFITGLSKGWQDVPILLQSDLRYPLKIQRFYIKDDGSKNALNGSVIFDNLVTVQYTDEYLEKQDDVLESKGDFFENVQNNIPNFEPNNDN